MGAGALVLALVMGLSGLLVVKKLAGGGAVDQSTPGAVIVVPGYGGSVSDVAPIVDHLRSEGRTVIAFRPSQGGTGDLR